MKNVVRETRMPGVDDTNSTHTGCLSHSYGWKSPSSRYVLTFKKACTDPEKWRETKRKSGLSLRKKNKEENRDFQELGRLSNRSDTLAKVQMYIEHNVVINNTKHIRTYTYTNTTQPYMVAIRSCAFFEADKKFR